MGSIHEGHRQRLRERFLKQGLDDFEAHNVLELLLFYAIPMKDTNELAHRLLQRFGSISAVFDADIDDLCQVDGVGRNTAVLLKMIPGLTRRYLEDSDKEPVILSSVEQIGSFLLPKFVGRTKEMVYLLCLNNKGGIAYADFVMSGTVNAAPMYSREIVEAALRSKAVSAILAHNHPKGIAVPSNADMAATKMVYDALASVKIRLLDHFIFAGTDYVSLKDSGFFSDL